MNFFPNVYFFGESLWDCKQVCSGNVDLAETGPKCQVGIKFEEVKGGVANAAAAHSMCGWEETMIFRKSIHYILTFHRS